MARLELLGLKGKVMSVSARVRSREAGCGGVVRVLPMVTRGVPALCPGSVHTHGPAPAESCNP